VPQAVRNSLGNQDAQPTGIEVVDSPDNSKIAGQVGRTAHSLHVPKEHRPLVADDTELDTAGVQTHVGTSICDKVVRASSNAAATPKLGANATHASSTLLGRCAPTIVTTRPNRRASRGAVITNTACTTATVKNSRPSTTSERHRSAG